MKIYQCSVCLRKIDDSVWRPYWAYINQNTHTTNGKLCKGKFKLVAEIIEPFKDIGAFI